MEIAVEDVNRYLARNPARVRFVAAIEDTRLEPDLALERAAVVHGASPLRAIVRITLPIIAPGILVQMITTKQPSDDQIEVAIVSMEQALGADGEVVPAGSELPEREPMELGVAEASA